MVMSSSELLEQAIPERHSLFAEQAVYRVLAYQVHPSQTPSPTLDRGTSRAAVRAQELVPEWLSPSLFLSLLVSAPLVPVCSLCVQGWILRHSHPHMGFLSHSGCEELHSY